MQLFPISLRSVCGSTSLRTPDLSVHDHTSAWAWQRKPLSDSQVIWESKSADPGWAGAEILHIPSPKSIARIFPKKSLTRLQKNGLNGLPFFKQVRKNLLAPFSGPGTFSCSFFFFLGGFSLLCLGFLVFLGFIGFHSWQSCGKLGQVFWAHGGEPS